MAKSKKFYFPELDGIRTLAAGVVVIAHCFHDFFENLIHSFTFLDNKYFDYFKGAIGAGREGVAVFFVLSGFLITLLLLKEIEKEGKVSVPKFYMRRVLRIWPLYYAVMFFGLFLYPALQSFLGNFYNQDLDYLLNLTFLNNIAAYQSTMNPDLSFWPHVGVAWSVAIEEQFYLFWPLLFLIKPTRKSLPFIFAGILVVSITFYSFNSNNTDLLYYHILGQIHNLLWGGIAAYIIFYFEKVKSFFIHLNDKYRLGIYLVGLGIFVIRKDLIALTDYYFIRSFISFSTPFLLLTKP